MGYKYPEPHKFLGLFLQQNSFDVPDGGMEIAENIIIQNDNELTKFAGFMTLYSPQDNFDMIQVLKYIDEEDATASGIYVVGYSNDDSEAQVRLLSGTFNGVNPVGIPTTLNGESFEIQDRSPLRIASFNGIEYMTTLSGVMRIERYPGAYGAKRLIQAGVPPAGDLTTILEKTSDGVLPDDSQTAYRAVFGRIDRQNNLLLGAPSDISTVILPAGGTGLTYTSNPTGPNWTVFVTAPDNGLQYGDEIVVANATDPDANGVQTITGITANSFNYLVSADPGSGTLNYFYSRNVAVEITIPGQINDANWLWFLRIYRTTSSVTADATPTPDFRLIAEIPLSEDDLTRGFYTFVDDVDPITLGPELYTNPNSQEGELQANLRPPYAYDLCTYKNYMFYANTKPYLRTQFQLVDPTQLITDNIIALRNAAGDIENFYGLSGTGNQTVRPFLITGTGTITLFLQQNHGLSTGDTVHISDVVGTALEGDYVATIGGASTITINVGVGLVATDLLVQGVFDSFGRDIYGIDFYSASLAQRIANTAQNLVKAINRRSEFFYANYLSTPEDLPGKIGLEYRTLGASITDFAIFGSGTNTVNAFVPPITGNFYETIRAKDPRTPHVFYVSKFSEADAVPLLNSFPIGTKDFDILRCFALEDGVVFVKSDGVFKNTGDILNTFTTSSIDTTIKGIASNACSLLNNRVFALSNQGAVQITTQSAQVVSRRIDRVIQDFVSGKTFIDTDEEQVVDNNDVRFASAVGYETARLWIASMQDDSNNVPAQTYIYNILNESWTTSDQLIRQAVNANDDRLYVLTEDNKIKVQRKYTQKLDYTAEYLSVYAVAKVGDSSVVYVSPRYMGSPYFSSGTYSIPKEGDILVFDNVISRIQSVTIPSPVGLWECQLAVVSNLPNTAEVEAFIYESYNSTWKMTPFHAGQVGREKQFCQLQLHLRQASISRLDIDYSTGYFTESGDPLDWKVTEIIAPAVPPGSGPEDIAYGWGEGPWGLFPWGSPEYVEWSYKQESVLIPVGTKPAPIVRTYIPLYAQRATYIQPTFVHGQAGELISLQALSYAVRGYGERTTR